MFKIGDKVFDIRHGWGEVKDFEQDLGWENMLVEFKENNSNKIFYYTLYSPEGECNDDICLLSFTKYTLNGFTTKDL